jgi:hypothetical protein
VISLCFDFTGAGLFLAYLNRQISLNQVLDHPAYQIVRQHASLFSNDFNQQDVVNALLGLPSPFYGLKGISDNQAHIQALLDVIQECESEWVSIIIPILNGLFADDLVNITVYPMIGYDMGIGLNGAVCMNLNHSAYLNEPMEFLFYVIHECVHVIYQRNHQVKPLSEINTPSDWLMYFKLWVQNEGYAVYVPLHLREASGFLDERDYHILFEPNQLENHRLAYLNALKKLCSAIPLPRDEYLDLCFGSMRLTYRLGCELVRRIEQTYGFNAVRQAFLLPCDIFFERYQHLLTI